MTVYQHRASLTVSGGSNNTLTLRVLGGVLGHFIVRARTDTTTFRANLVDEASLTILNYGYQRGEVNDTDIHIPVVGRYTINITNTNPATETFDVLFTVQEKG